MTQKLHMNPFYLITCMLSLIGLNLGIQKSVIAQTLDNNAKHPQPMVVSFDPALAQYQELFDGANDSVVFYSGVVTLTPGQSGELHSTEIYEEIIIPLEGQGQLRITDHNALDVKYGTVGFVPPDTQHQMFNNGTGNFKYIYVAAKSKK